MNQSDRAEERGEPAPRHVQFNGFASAGEEAPVLEGKLSLIKDGALHPGVLLLHANPAAGGNMDMGVMSGIEAQLAAQGFATLRYNSRGVEGSTGTITNAAEKKLVIADAEPELADASAALAFLAMQEGVDNQRLAFVGHSFGARLALAYVEAHPEDTSVCAVVCIGLAVGWRDLSHLGQWPRPKLFVTGEKDDFSPPEKLEEFITKLPPPTERIVLQGTGHFFEGREDELASVISSFLSRVML